MTIEKKQDLTLQHKHSVCIHRRHLIITDELDSLSLHANNGIFEPEETLLCQKLIHPGDRVLDIGANIGYYTLLFCDLVSPGGHVWAFEPDAENFRYLQHNLTNLLAKGVVSLHSAALGEKLGKAQLYRAAQNTGMHRLYASACCSDEHYEVSVITGDSLALAPVNFIKIDIEGYEPYALRGLTETIKNSPEVKILCEFSPLSIWEAGFHPILFLEQMQKLGFHLLVQSEHTWINCTFERIIDALQHIPDAAVSEFISNQAAVGNHQIIVENVQAFLVKHGYDRPLLENILFVAPVAWPTVCAALAISSSNTLNNDIGSEYA